MNIVSGLPSLLLVSLITNGFIQCDGLHVNRFCPGINRRSSSLSAVLLSQASPDLTQAKRLIAEGMMHFREGEVQRSIELFDQAEATQPSGVLTPFLWQRGISYYYSDKFSQASQQFRTDVRVNPVDVEEIVWDIASQLRAHPEDFPPSNRLSLPAGAQDRRRIMLSVYNLFRGEGSERNLAEAGRRSSSASDQFYALLYLGLFCEARGEVSKAELYMRRSARTPYAQTSMDYMVAVAQVHCKLRGWDA